MWHSGLVPFSRYIKVEGKEAQGAILDIIHTKVVNVIGKVICYSLTFHITMEFPSSRDEGSCGQNTGLKRPDLFGFRTCLIDAIKP